MRFNRKLRRHASARGFTLIEAMISFTVLGVGLLGLMAAHVAAARSDGQGMRISQATSIAQSVGSLLMNSRWGDAALADSIACNNADVDDQAKEFAKAGGPSCKADHQLQLSGVSLAQADALRTLETFKADDKLDYNGDGSPDFEVYWNVANCTVSSVTTPWTFTCASVAQASADAKQIGIIVRWRGPSGDWYEVSSQFARYNPSNIGS